ncbi:MAG TPA: IS110 family transposase [Actinocrinis sp.]|uniref:IS110 family transposase n=1 Tax=Actinocrinis sp. TaxID=1920516 RepID=UPI002DDD5753|nr:IS110 family transposase [Actinocrinis sp.]HEV2345357.1 IS110 family transposase [Actinocrinis sp.]
MTDDTDSLSEILWFVGLDWGSESHRVALFDRTGALVERRDVAHTGRAYGELCDWLLRTTRAAPGQIGVAIETSHGPVVDALLDRGIQVFAINPKQLDKFRDRYSMAGAKDDTRDADTLGRCLRTDRDAFRPLSLSHPLLVQLRGASRLAEELTRTRGQLANQLREQLWRYYPQMLTLADDDGVADPWLLDLWQAAPTPAKGARLHKQTIEHLLKQHRIRRLDVAQVRQVLREPALPVAPGVAEAATRHIRSLLPRLRLVTQQLKQVRTQIDTLCDAFAASHASPAETPAGDTSPGQASEQRDVAILRSLPGIGRINLATLLAEAYQPLQRRDYHALRALCGAAPVTRRSGKSCIVLRRLACNKRLANALYHWARVATQRDPLSQGRYQALRQRGHSHGRALRTVGDRLLALTCTLLQRQVLFDPSHRGARANTPSPLVQVAA